ncbi:MAG: DUF6691 family protein [Verrucomicrobiaceae bacterium]|jgi:uncharacterized membrane protein YedE/YeeE
MLPLVLSLAAGLLFGAGLAISDMMNPARVLNFFDVAGTWDPTLVFVMAGALATTAIGYRIVFARGKPLVGSAFNLPTAKQIDLPLIGGAAVFGIGWGMAGFCPGPAIAALVSLQPKVLIFILSLTAGMILTNYLRNWYAAMRT